MKSPTVTMDGQKAVIAWVDSRANGNNVYITQIDYSATDIDDFEPNTLPSGYDLKQNYPNPFNPSTTIEFALPSKSHVRLEIYNLLGRKIATITDKLFESGIHTVDWDGTNSNGEHSASGVYFYRIETDKFEQTRKMILLK
ncbi:MAG: T9SS type A sorting domain-containing protein [candidate division Zixibacteria bacterium]|nr:T9SS type A sorting domain-containing protein [candidate division Zixibacteria bacterium]